MKNLISLGRCSRQTKGAFTSQVPDDADPEAFRYSDGVIKLTYCSDVNPEFDAGDC